VLYTLVITGAMRLQYISKIILLYICRKHKELKLPVDQPTELIFDDFKGHCTSELLTLLDTNNISVILVPPNYTDRLQPLDVSVNKAAKGIFKNMSGVPNKSALVYKEKSLSHRLSIVKPLGAQWMVNLYDYIKGKPIMK